MAEEENQEEMQQQMEATNGDEQTTEETTTDTAVAQFNEEEKESMMDDDDEDDDTEDDRKLFVGGLSWETTPKELREYFEKFGEVTNCTLKTDYVTKKSRGFGFVCFGAPDTVDKVLLKKDAHKLHGRNIDPKKATPRPKKIFVGKLDPAVVEDDVKEYFSTFGEVEKMEFPFDKSKEQRRAFCFVEFKRMSGLKKCLEATVHKIKGQEVDVKKATPPQPSGNSMRGGPRGRGFGGAGRGGGRGGFDGYGGYNQGGYSGYGNYGGYGYDQNYSGYGGYGNDGYYGGGYGYGGWNNGGYDQGYYGGYGNQSNYGKSQKRGAGQGGYHPYNR